MNPQKSKWLISGFLITLVSVSAFLTLGLSPYLKAAAERSDAFDMLGKCMAVESADILLIRQAGEQREVRLLGVEAPSMAGDPEQAMRLGLAPELLAREGLVSRNTLAAWVYRRGLRIEYPLGLETTDEEGRPYVYAEIAGVDLARKLLQGGQVVMTDVVHPRLELYLEMQASARERGFGIWRHLPQ